MKLQEGQSFLDIVKPGQTLYFYRWGEVKSVVIGSVTAKQIKFEGRCVGKNFGSVIRGSDIEDYYETRAGALQGQIDALKRQREELTRNASVLSDDILALQEELAKEK